ncbi:MAG: hypothetical protein HY897_07795 [Deltaproteobacteria bacterium]|nr:hypothetical protein [Deltaproteobacteria bacterium]
MRKFTVTILVLVFGITAFGACSDDEDKVEANPAQVDAAKNSVMAVNTAKSNPTDVTAVMGLSALYTNASTLLAAATTSESSSLSRALEGSESGCVTSSGNTYNYDACGTITGTMTIDGDTVTFDLSIAFSGGASAGGSSYGADVAVTLKGDVTATSDSLKGEVEVAMTANVSGSEVPGGSTSAAATTSIDYDVTLDSSGCPTGGTMTVAASASASSGGSSSSGSATVTAEFGPACGDVALVVTAAGE